LIGALVSLAALAAEFPGQAQIYHAQCQGEKKQEHDRQPDINKSARFGVGVDAMKADVEQRGQEKEEQAVGLAKTRTQCVGGFRFNFPKSTGGAGIEEIVPPGDRDEPGEDVRENQDRRNLLDGC